MSAAARNEAPAENTEDALDPEAQREIRVPDTVQTASDHFPLLVEISEK